MHCGAAEPDYQTLIDVSAGQGFTLVFWALIQHILVYGALWGWS